MSGDWLGLMIGNSRLHWGYFCNDKLVQAWDTKHEQLKTIIGSTLPPHIFLPHLQDLAQKKLQLPLYFASVVPQQTLQWQTYSRGKLITLEAIPLQGIYNTLGIDRALAVWGAGVSLAFPILVIDGGTALTLTGVDDKLQLRGGAILPGLSLQLSSLATKTGSLPQVELPSQLPARWGLTTPNAILSGVIYTIIAGIRDFIINWQQSFPQTQIVLTGGDGELLLSYLKTEYPELAAKIVIEKNLILKGIALIRTQLSV